VSVPKPPIRCMINIKPVGSLDVDAPYLICPVLESRHEAIESIELPSRSAVVVDGVCE
jgi:hypothetical protein